MTLAAVRRGIEFPPGTDGAALLRPLYHSAFKLPALGPTKDASKFVGGSDYRRAITYGEPLLFALTYLNRADAPYLRQQDSGVISFSQFHLDMCERAKLWMRRAPARDIDVAPRGAAKSFWKFLGLPLWALAHGHRSSFLAFALNGGQAELHLANLRRELKDNTLLLADFPELHPRRGANTKETVVLAGGGSFAARGLTGNTLGFRVGASRPDLIIGDDLEPQPGQHTPAKREMILDLLVNSVLPMEAPHAVVQLAGTTTMRRSLMHDAVQAARGGPVAPWLTEHGFIPHHYPPYVIDPQTGAEASMWPQRWSLELLRDKQRRNPNGFALNYLNDPELAESAGFFSAEHFVVKPSYADWVPERVLYIDPAMTNNARSDQTAIVVGGRYGAFAVIDWAKAGRWPADETKHKVWQLVNYFPNITEIIVESNQGGNRVAAGLKPLPRPGIEMFTEHVGGSKRSRVETALAQFQREAVVLAKGLPQLEEQACAWTPAADEDDLLDALAGTLRRLFPDGSAKYVSI